MTYTVREPGHSCWAGPGLTLREARKQLRRARDTGLHRAVILTDTDPPVIFAEKDEGSEADWVL